MTLPYDFTRCDGVRQQDGKLQPPCNRCRRVLESLPQGPRSPWFMQPPVVNGSCRYVMEAA